MAFQPFNGAERFGGSRGAQFFEAVRCAGLLRVPALSPLEGVVDILRGHMFSMYI